MSCPAGATPGLPLDGHVINRFCVNRGAAVPVWSGSFGQLDNVQIGTLGTNDYFRLQWSWLRPNTWDPNWPYDFCVLVRNSSGVLQWGFVNSASQWPAGFVPVEDQFFLSEQAWNGMTLRTYTIQNRGAVLRNRSGGIIETLPIGSTIAVRAGVATSMGQSWCTYWQVTAVLRSGQWQWADQAGSTWGFVDTGLPFNRPNTSTIRTSLA